MAGRLSGRFVGYGRGFSVVDNGACCREVKQGGEFGVKPLISVVLPVYNGSAYLREAVGSILEQTYRDFELIIINDGSSDDSSQIISTFGDQRIRAFDQENIGLAATLNRGISLSRGSYVARQDQDDISYPTRLAKQIAFLEKTPRCGMVGTWAEIWRETDRTDRAHRHPSENGPLKLDLLFNNPFVHSSMMLRREVFGRGRVLLHGPIKAATEDYEMWSRVCRRFDVANIPEILHVYREAQFSMSRERWEQMMDMVVAISAENIADAAGLSDGNAQARNLAALANGVFGKITGRPNPWEMKRIYCRAAENATASCAGDVSRKMIRQRWQSIRYNYCKYVAYPLLGSLIRRYRKPL